MDISIINRMESSQEFKKLPYHEQVRARFRLWPEVLKDDSRFNSLSLIAKRKAIETLAYSTPGFENDSIQNEINLLTEQYKAGEKKARGTLASMAHTRIINDIWSVKRFAEKNVLGPIIDKLFPMKQLSDYPGYYEYNYGKDSRKISAYVDHLLSRSEADKYGQEPLKGKWVSSIVGMAGDLATMYALTGAGAPTKAIGAGLRQHAATVAKDPKWVARIWGTIAKKSPTSFVQSRAGQWLLTTGATEAAKSIAEGGKDVLRDALKRRMDSIDGFEVAERKIIDIAKIFGAGAARDYLFAMGMNVLVPISKGVYRSVRGYKDLLDTIKKASDGDYAKMLAMAEIGKTVPGSVVSRAPEHVRDRIEMIQDINKSLKQTEKLVPGSFRQAQVNAYTLNNSLVLREGKYVLRNFSEPSKAVKLDSMVKVNDRLGNQLVKQLSKVDESEAANLITEWNAHLLNYSGKTKWLDDIVDPEHIFRSDVGIGPKPTQLEVAAEINKLRHAIKTKAFIPLSNRQYGTIEELNVAFKRASLERGKPYKVASGLKSEIGSGEHIPTEGRTWDLAAAGEPDTYIFSHKIAPYDEYANIRATADTIEGTSVNNELLRHGYDAAFINPGQNKLLTLREAGVKFLTDKLNPATGRYTGRKMPISSKLDPLTTVKPTHSFFIQETVKGKIPLKELAGDEVTMSKILASGLEGGEIEAARVRDFTMIYLAKKGISVKDYDNILFKSDPSQVVKVTVEGRDLTIRIPKNLKTPGHERLFVRSLVDRLEEAAAKINPYKVAKVGEEAARVVKRAGQRASADIAKKAGKAFLTKNYVPALEKGRIWSTTLGSELVAKKWASKFVKEAFEGYDVITSKSGKLQLMGISPEGSKVIGTYDSADALINDLLPDVMNEAEAVTAAAREGLRLVKRHGGGYKISSPSGKIKPIEGETYSDVIREAGVDPRIPNRFMPKRVVIDEGIAEVTFVGREAAVPNIHRAYKLLDKFESTLPANLNPLFTKGDRTVFKLQGKGYLVRDMETAWFDTFETVADAKKLMGSATDDLKILKKMAREKNMKVEVSGKGYDILIGNQYFHAADAAGLKKLIKTTPLPEAMPELIDEANEVASIIGKTNFVPAKGTFKPVDYMEKSLEEASAELPLKTRISSWFKPTDEVLPQLVYKSGHKRIVELFRGLESGLTQSKTHTKYYMALIGRGLKEQLPNGKLKAFSKESQGRITEYMRAVYQAKIKGESVSGIAEALKVTGKEVEAAEHVWDILGRDPTKALAGLFLEDTSQFIFYYLPRLRKGIERLTAKELQNLGADIDVVKKVLGKDSTPKSIEFWARHNRLNDLLEMSVENDIYTIMRKYVTLGMKRLYMNPKWEALTNYVKVNKRTIPSELLQTISLWKEQVLGIPSSFGLKQMKEVGSALAAKIGLDKKIMDNTIMGLFSLNYMANMGWRPYLPFRNLWQVFTTLGPRFGNKWVKQAIAQASDPKIGQRTFEHLQNIGEVLGRTPIFLEGVEGGQLINKLTRNSLKMYKNSDGWTRVVGYLTVKGPWDDAFKAYSKGLINDRGFLYRAGVTLIDKDIQNEVSALIRQGEWNAALDVYASRGIRDTLFDYRPEMRPRVFASSLPGKAFGMYGTYAAYYIANLLKGFRNGTKAQRIAFGARWVANSMAIWGAFQLAGINANNFLPWAPALFTGGPLYYLGMDAIQAFGSGYQGRQARGKLASMIPFNTVNALAKGQPLDWTKVPRGWIPGAFQYKAFNEFINTIEDDPLHAISALMTAPVKPETPDMISDVLQLYPETGPMSHLR